MDDGWKSDEKVWSRVQDSMIEYLLKFEEAFRNPIEKLKKY